MEVNDEPKKRPRKKVYRPKVVSQLSKRAEKSQLGRSTKTPKPSTPKPRRSYVRKDPKRQKTLFVDEDTISLPSLKNSNVSKGEQDGFESSTLRNEAGIEYNSLQSSQEITSLPSSCLVESRHILSLEKLLIPTPKGKRSKSFVRKRKCWTKFIIEGKFRVKRGMRVIINKIKSLKKNRKTNQLDGHNKTGELVPYKRSSVGVKVILDEETLRVWGLLTVEKGHEENDMNKRRYWEETRRAYHELVTNFISRMHIIQGDRRFSPWKGSVMDSVVGAFLTQNVSDGASSSAFMSLAAIFPIKSFNCEQRNKELSTPSGQEFIPNNNVVILEPIFNKELEDIKVEEIEVALKDDESSTVYSVGKENSSSFMEGCPSSSGVIFGKQQSFPKKKSTSQQRKEKLLEEQRQYWAALRKIHSSSLRQSEHVDCVDWEAVRNAKPKEVADAIASRGLHNLLARRIQHLLNKLKDSTGSVDLEWLRHAPPKEAKEYLLDIDGLGLKSVECIRLLTLHHSAFPVDVNVGRIVVRLGWVPLQPLPEPIQIHNLEEFPDPIKIQQFLWPRLCTLDRRTLYELHYQLITFGKVFCTKRNPNCNACPMRMECKHYASSLARERLSLPEPTVGQKDEGTSVDPKNTSSFEYSSSQCIPWSSFFTGVHKSITSADSKECEPIIEMPASPEVVAFEGNDDEEIYNDGVYCDNEDIGDIEDIPTINLINEKCSPMRHDFYSKEIEHDMGTSTALVALPEDVANNPIPKMKNVSRLKTERLVYVLTDNHPLLAEYAPREADDPSPYLLLVWTTDEFVNSLESSKIGLQEEDNSQTVRGTLLIPCRSAMRGFFPLNGTYFQVNEVFADHASMINPISVPRNWLWHLETRIVYFGTGISAIMRGLSSKEIHNCFWKGFVCVRAIDTKTRAPRPISSILHCNTTAKVGKENKSVDRTNHCDVPFSKLGLNDLLATKGDFISFHLFSHVACIYLISSCFFLTCEICGLIFQEKYARVLHGGG